MNLGRQSEKQNTMWISWDAMPKSKGHAFYDRLQAMPLKQGFDRFVEQVCSPFYTTSLGRKSYRPPVKEVVLDGKRSWVDNVVVERLCGP